MTTPACRLTLQLPAPLAADLRRLADRLDDGPSRVAASMVAAYVAVFETTEASGGLPAWLDRLFEASLDASPRVAVTLQLPAWQVAALRHLAEAEVTDVDTAFAAMVGPTLRRALTRPATGGLPAAYARAFQDLLAEHRPEPGALAATPVAA